jgi:hypothetical protein
MFGGFVPVTQHCFAVLIKYPADTVELSFVASQKNKIPNKNTNNEVNAIKNKNKRKKS